VFNKFGDVERCALRPGNVHSAVDWRAVLEPVIARYQGTVKRLYFRGDAAFANPQMYELLETEGVGYTIRLPANNVLPNRIAYLLKRPVGRPPHEVRRYYASFTYQAELEQAAPRPGQARMASGRALPARRLHHHQPGAASRADRRLLQPARYGGELDQRRQGCDQMDAAVMPNLRRQRRRLHLQALAYNLGNFVRTLAMPKAAEPWSLKSLRQKLIKIGAKVVSHGRYVTFQMAEVAVSRILVRDILMLIAGFGRRSHQRERCKDRMRQRTTAGVPHEGGKATSFRRDEAESIDSAARGTNRGPGMDPQTQTMALACPAIRAKTLS
jgi:hypothetical protein